jgi:hypothetical protein
MVIAWPSRGPGWLLCPVYLALEGVHDSNLSDPMGIARSHCKFAGIGPSMSCNLSDEWHEIHAGRVGGDDLGKHHNPTQGMSMISERMVSWDF